MWFIVSGTRQPALQNLSWSLRVSHHVARDRECRVLMRSLIKFMKSFPDSSLVGSAIQRCAVGSSPDVLKPAPSTDKYNFLLQYSSSCFDVWIKPDVVIKVDGEFIYAVFNTTLNSISDLAICIFNMDNIMAPFEANYPGEKGSNTLNVLTNNSDIQ